MSDDSMNWEIVFDASIGPGVPKVEERLLGLERAMRAVHESGTGGEVFKEIADDMAMLAKNAEDTRAAFQNLESAKQKLLASDRLQNVSGGIDAYLKEVEANTKAASDQLRAFMQEEARLKESAFASPYQSKGINDLYIDRDAKARADASNLIKVQMQEEAKTAEETARAETKAAEDAARAQIKAAEDVAKTKERLASAVLTDQTLAGGLRYSATNKIESANLTTSKAIPGWDLASADKLNEKTSEAERQVRTLTKAFEDEGKAAAAAGKEFTPAEQSARLQELRQKVNDVTTALGREAEAIRTTARASEEASRAQVSAAAKQVKAAELAANPVRTQGLGNFYPLIVAAGIFGGLARATEGLGIEAAKTSAKYQEAFASVARTTNSDGGDAAAQIDAIRKSLLELDTQIPLSFEDLSKIATAGNEIGVSSAGITGFTKTVAEYSAVTGAAADVTATAFGSLGQILKIPSTEFENFGSAVSLVGRKSVATEAQVLSMTAKIGATAHQANFTTSEILGLAGALASLQEAPERSQGALEIYFKNVNAAAAAGGAKLQAFADATHMSAEAAKDLIKNNPYQFLLDLLKSIGNEKGIVAQTTLLQGLGLSATRVSEVLRRLSTNTDLLGNLTNLANQGYAQGTDLSQQYAKATDTLAAKFKELQNSFNNFLASLGGSGLEQALTVIVNGLKDIIIGITGFAQANPVFTNIVIAFAAMAGALLAVRAASLGATIATIALESAQIRLRGVNKLDGLKTLITLLTGYEFKVNAATRAADANAAAQTRMIAAMMDAGVVKDEAAAMQALGISETVVASETEMATGAMVGFRAVLLTLGIPALIIGLTALATAFLSASDSSASFDSTGLQNAMKADEETFKKTGIAIQQIKVSTDTSKTSADDWVGTLNKAAGAEAELNDKTTTTTKSIDAQTIAYGKNAKAALQNVIANDSSYQKLFSDSTIAKNLQGVGFQPGKFAQLVVGDPTGQAGRKYVDQYIAKLQQVIKERATDKTGNGDQGATRSAQALLALGPLLDTITSQVTAAAVADAAYKSAHSQSNQAVAQGTVYEEAYAAAMAQSSQAQLQNNQLVGAGTAEQDAYLTSLFAGVNAFYAQSSALSTMGQEYVQSGAAAAFSGAAFQAYIKSVIESDPSTAAVRLQELENSILAAGYASSASSPSLAYLNQVIASLGGSDTKALATDVFPSFTDAVKAANAAMAQVGGSADSATSGLDKLAKQVITVTDYASNLSSTFKEAFDIRFGKQQGIDEISQQFQSMQDNAKSAKKSIDDARKSIQQYEASISKTRADNVQQKYFLGVANQFGDSTRSSEIQSTIDSNNASISSDTQSLKQAQLDLAAAEDKLNTSYTSNTAGAIANRSALYQLAQKYEDYITKLATSGASQKQLNEAVKKAKENFDKQATSLGYSKGAIEKVNGAFSDMITVIKNIPPANISITGLSAGEAAVKNFMAKLNASVTNGVKGINNTLKGIGSTPIPGPSVKPRMSTGQALRESIKSQMLPYISYLQFAGNSPSLADSATVRKYEQALRALDTELEYVQGNYAEGGYTGPGGKYQPAGTVHKGEYVVPAYMVNQSTGLPYADALGRLISGMPSQGGGYANGGYVSGDMMVTELGPRSLGVLRQMVNNEVVAVISAGNVTNAVNSTNAANRRRGR